MHMYTKPCIKAKQLEQQNNIHTYTQTVETGLEQTHTHTEWKMQAANIPFLPLECRGWQGRNLGRQSAGTVLKVCRWASAAARS